MQCPCNKNMNYDQCCKKAHQNILSVKTAETLMRSRYSAFVLHNIDYLQLSHHSNTCPSNKEKKEILQWTKSVNWIKLEVINSTINTVEFKAYFIENGKVDVIHENSFFKKENNHWVYLKAF